ncbi:MAG: transglutaminase domain-containing protein [Chloroflexi bacterium]|nr:transglutaminase domain-containing protein [Chloroflexota bacterium]
MMREVSTVGKGSPRWARVTKLLRALAGLLRSGVRELSEGWPDLLSVVFIFAVLGVAVYSFDRAKWTYPQPSLVLVLFLSMVITLVSVRIPMPGWAKHTAIIVAGVGTTAWQIASLPLFLPWWWEMTRQPNQTTIHFTMLMLLATWMTGYASTWFFLRHRNPWMAVVLGAIVTVANLSNLPKDNYYFFALYVLGAVLLLGQVNLVREHRDLSEQGRRFLRHGALYYAGVVFTIGVITASAALFVPEVRLSHLGSAIFSKISLQNAEKMWLNIFAAVPGKWDILRSEREEQLFFSDPPSQSDVVQFVVSAHDSDYWRTRRYHTYFSWGWTGNSTMDNMFYPGKDVFAAENIRREDLTYSVTNKLKTDVLLTTGEFKTSNLPVKLQTFEHQSVLSSDDVVRKDVISVTAPRLLQPEEPYTITVSLVRATPLELSQADANFDLWFAEHYLQLPDTLPDRVRRLSRTVTRGARTPYDKVIAVKEYLEGLKYSRAFIAAPDGADAVDFFLFEARQGDCFQFASATAVMLRSVGVPARISAGYRLTEQDRNATNFILRARDYHARAEVYFPEYGWIEFETTPGLSPEEAISSGRNNSPSENIDDMEFIGGSEGASVTAGAGAGIESSWKRAAYISTAIAFLTVLLTVLTAAYFLYLRWLYRLSLTGDPAYLYAKMCSLASRGKVGPHPAETPLEYSARLSTSFPEQTEDIGNITASYVQTRFSPKKDLDPAQRVKLEKSWVQLYPTIVQSILPFKRRQKQP